MLFYNSLVVYYINYIVVCDSVLGLFYNVCSLFAGLTAERSEDAPGQRLHKDHLEIINLGG